MRIILWILAAVGALALGVVGLVFYGVFAATGGLGPGGVGGAVKDAEAYAIETITAYGAEWDPATLEARGSEEFLAAVAGGTALAEMSDMLRRMAGPIETVDAVDCSSFQITKVVGESGKFVAGCLADGDAARAALSFRVNVRKQSDEWRILGFFVEYIAVNEESRAVEVNAIAGAPDAAPPPLLGVVAEAPPAATRSLSLAGRTFAFGSNNPIRIGAGVTSRAD
ncbi:MAG: hypothetical protein GC152_05420 [Alphaproteobacteria bacterium]|nr:hypothetical protein [Alphaproteobacteria bacterium]